MFGYWTIGRVFWVNKNDTSCTNLGPPVSEEVQIGELAGQQ